MKKIVLLLALLVATLTVSAENILYFTYSQATRTVPFLNNQDELMIYCGYPDELPTYVLVNEVWAEQISSSFYEIWLYGYDAYTGEEVYMPIDLGCIWLVNRGSIYSAAQALRIRTTNRRPTFAWAMPPYNPFVRHVRPVTFYYTYHYDIHRPGWRYDLYPSIHYHPYYLRRPSMPAPMPPVPYTPGREYPGYHVNNNGTYTYTQQPLLGNITACRSQITVQNNPSGRSGNTITSNRSNNTITTTDRTSGRATTTTAPTRSNDNNRGTNINTRESNNRGTNINTRESNNRGTNINTRESDNRGTNINTRESDNRGTNVNTRESNNRGSNVTTRESNSSSTPSNTRNAGVISSDNNRSSNAPRSSVTTRENNSSSSVSTNSSRNSSTSNSKVKRSGNNKATGTTSRNTSSGRVTNTDNSGSANANAESSNTSRNSQRNSSSTRTATTR